MRINELVQTGEREEQYEVTLPEYFDPVKQEVVHSRAIKKTKIVPIMEIVSREMTEEEIAKFTQESSPKDKTPTQEQRIEALEAAMIELIMGGSSSD